MLRKLAVVLLAVLAVLATTIPASSASAATSVTVASLLMFNGDIVQGIDVPRARVAVSPAVEGATVQLQYLKTVNGVQHWYSGGIVRTRAGGVVIVKFALDGTGTTTWRAVVT